MNRTKGKKKPFLQIKRASGEDKKVFHWGEDHSKAFISYLEQIDKKELEII